MTLPEGWVEATLGDLGIEAQPGFPSGRHNKAGAGIPHLRPMNVSRTGRIELKEVKYIDTDRDLRLRVGDVLFNNTNSPPLVGKTAYFDKPGEFVFSNHMTRLRVPAGIDAKFLATQLHTLWERGFFRAICTKHVNQASVSTKPLLAVSVALPPLAEQRRIVAAIEEQFSRLDAAETSFRTALARIKAVRRAALGSLDSHPLTHVVGDVADVRGGIQKQPKRRPASNRHPFLRVANVLRGRLDLRDVHEVELFDGELDRYRLRPGDLLVVEGNGSRDQIGRSAIWRGEIEDCVHQNHLIRVRPGPEVDPTYLALYWNAPGCAERLAQVASTTSGLYTLSVSKLQRLRIAVPPSQEQRQIVAMIEQQLSQIDALRAAVEAAQKRSAALRRAILERAFRGELVPQDPADEPASVLLERIRAERAAAPKARQKQRTA